VVERRVKSRRHDLSLEALTLRAALRGASREDAKSRRKDAKNVKSQSHDPLFASCFAPSRLRVRRLHPSVQPKVRLGVLRNL
jgi:hypothetical protein